MTETVTIKEVTSKGNGWFNVELEGDDRVLATKREKLAELANASVGSPVEVEINTREKGRFTDHYLEAINGEKGDSVLAKARIRSVAPRAAASGTTAKSGDVQERIARQWAFGRATELLIASDREFSFPLDADTLASLEAQANALLNATR